MGWGGMLTFMWNCTHTWCFVKWRFTHAEHENLFQLCGTQVAKLWHMQTREWKPSSWCYVADVLHLSCNMLLVNGKSSASFEDWSSKKTSCCNKLHSSRKQTKWKEEHFTWENTCNQASSALMCLPHLRLRLKTWQTDAKLEKNFRASCNVPKLK